MSIQLRGGRELQARLSAIGDTSQLLRKFAPLGLRHIKIETPRKTGNLSRANAILSVSDREVRYGNRANYAVPVHEGSKPHTIVPTRRKALRFAPSASGRRLSGSPQTGAQVVFAKRVRHPGNKANPFMARGLRSALAETDFGRAIVDLWDKAA
jgi:hypothetical protein